MLNGMRGYPTLLIKFKDEKPRKFSIIFRSPTQPFCNFINLFAGSDAAIKSTDSFALGFALGLPSHDEFLGAFVGGGGVKERCAVLDHTLIENDELHVEKGNSTPGYGGGPKSGVVGDPARHAREMGVGRWEEVKGDSWGEDFGWERRS